MNRQRQWVWIYIQLCDLHSTNTCRHQQVNQSCRLPKPEKEGPTLFAIFLLPQKAGQPQAQEGRANPNPKRVKGQPNRKGQPQPQEGRANPDPKGQLLSSFFLHPRKIVLCDCDYNYNYNHTKLANPDPKEEGPTPTPRRKGQAQPEGPTSTPRRKGQPQPKRGKGLFTIKIKK